MHTPPELPPLPSKAPAAPAPLPPMADPKPAAASFGTRRVRQIASALLGGSFTLVFGVVVLETIAQPEYRPSTLAAMLEARTELSVMNIKFGHSPGVHVLTEGDYQKAIAQAQRAGQAAAELEFQKQLAGVQADKEILVGAYQNLYQVTLLSVQAAIQLETIAIQFRQRLVEMSSGGRVMVINAYDLACGFGVESACQSARELRANMISESDELSRGDVSRRIKEAMANVPDPASLIAKLDREKNGTPHLNR